MTDRERKFLSDIIHSISLINQFTGNTSDFLAYTNDKKPKVPLNVTWELLEKRSINF